MRRRTRWLVALLGVLLLVSPGAAQESAPAEEIGLSATIGFGGRGPQQGWTPVEVALHPTRLVTGTLVLDSQGGTGSAHQRRTIEVAAGSRKVYRFVVPSGPVTVMVAEPGRDIVSARPRGIPSSGEFLVGVLGAVPGDAAPLRHDPTGMGGAWVPVNPAWLELSHRPFDSVSALVADPVALADLEQQARLNLIAAVAAGLDLVIPAGPGGRAPDWLPWHPDAAPRNAELGADVLLVSAGKGRVVLLGSQADAALADRTLWSDLTGPRPGLAAHADWAVERNPWEFPRLLHEPGGAAPTLPWLAVFILAYVLVVGPVNVLVLARFRRRELAWVTVPLVTAVFTTGAFLGAVGGRPPIGIAAQLNTWVDGAATETVVLAARAPTAGDHRLSLDGEGWTLHPVMAGGGGPAIMDATAGGSVTAFALDALEFGGLIATRGSDGVAPLEVNAAERDDGLTVSVRNVGSTPVHGITVHAATATRMVGDLQPGESATAAIGTDSLPVAELHFRPAQGASPPRSLEALLTSQLRDGNPGLVWAVGETDERVEGVRVGGQDPTALGRLVAVAVRPDAGRSGPFVVGRAAVPARQDLYQPGPLAVDGPGPLFLRFRFPPGSDVSTVASQLDRGAQFGNPELSVWDHSDDTWQPLATAFPDGEGDPARLLSGFGELWVRVSGELFPFDFSARTVTGGAR